MPAKSRITAAVICLAAGVAGCSSHAASIPLHAGIASSSAAAQVAPPAALIARRMGLKVTVYTAATDPNQLLGRQHQYTSKANWGNFIVGEDSLPSGGSIEVFADPADMSKRMSYLGMFAAPLGDGWDFTHGTAILRLSPSYTPAQAKALETSFDRAAS
jgi:hypothetical protein